MVWLSYSWDDLWIGYTPIATGINIAGREWKIFHTASTNAVFVPAERFSDLTPVTFTLSLDQFINAAIEHVPYGEIGAITRRENTAVIHQLALIRARMAGEQAA